MSLIKLELINLFGINVFRKTKDRRKKNRQTAMALVFAGVILAALLQLWAQSRFLAHAGAGALLPMLMGLTAEALIFFFALFDRSLFSPAGYEQLCTMPVRGYCLGLARLVRLYVQYFLLGVLVTLPYWGEYIRTEGPEGMFYVRYGAGLLLQPVLPICLSGWIQGGILALSVRCTRRTAVEISLQTLTMAAVLVLPAVLMGFPPIPRTAGELVALLETLGGALPGWTAERFTQGQAFRMFTGLSLGAAAVTLLLLPGCWERLMKKQAAAPHRQGRSSGLKPGGSLLRVLYEKEKKLYFSSSVYVSNTIIGPILATLGAGALLFVPVESLGLPFDLARALPFGWCALCVLLSPASVSLSMEGDRIWILKTLPVPVGAAVRAKLLWNLTLWAPAYVLSGIFLELGGMGGLWFWVPVPGMLLFSALFGITVNFHFQNYSWEKPEEIVKQSLPAVLGGLIPAALCFLCAGVCTALPGFRWVLLPLLLLADGLLYRICLRGRWADT